MDVYGQGWKTALGHAVKYHVHDIDLDWRQVSKDAKTKIVKQMEEKFGTGVMPSDIVYWAGRSFNHWKDYLTRSKTPTAPMYIEPDVWERFLESRKADHTQQKKAASARKPDERQRWGRRGFDGMLADYFQDWGTHPSATTIKKIKAKGTYKLYRESVIAEGRIHGNFKSVDFIGKKGEKMNKQLKRQRKEKRKNIEVPEASLEKPADDLANEEQNLQEQQNVDLVDEEDNHGAENVEGEMAAGEFQKFVVQDDMDWERDEREVDHLVSAGGTPPWAKNMLDEVASAAPPEKEKELVTSKKKKKAATGKNDNGTIKTKKAKKGRGVGRNLSPDFGEATVAKNIAQYKSLLRGK